MPHFFISYAKKDTRELALALNDALNAVEGITAWVDKSLRAGKSWELQIQSEIDRCDFMIILYSPDINRHKHGEEESYVLTEIAYAKYTAKKPIIPVMAQKTPPPMSLTTAHYIDFTISGLSVNDLMIAICDEAGIAAHSTLTPPSTPKPSTPITVSAPITILPPPFAWIDIPAGKVTLEAGGYLKKATTFDVPAFSIAKYPVTNGQFAKFMEADGYTQEKWWTKAGWEQKQKANWKIPRFWQNSDWNRAEYPVVGVSWYEALAFCRWLRDVSSEDILLPGEQQWQRAAQGDDGRLYPWGSEWDATRCNNTVVHKGLGRTTPVKEYEGKGDSPFGVVDMSGNVWEWCLTEYETGKTDLDGTGVRVLRGGSWGLNNTYFFRTGYRLSFNPHDWVGYIGLRIARS